MTFWPPNPLPPITWPTKLSFMASRALDSFCNRKLSPEQERKFCFAAVPNFFHQGLIIAPLKMRCNIKVVIATIMFRENNPIAGERFFLSPLLVTPDNKLIAQLVNPALRTRLGNARY